MASFGLYLGDQHSLSKSKNRHIYGNTSKNLSDPVKSFVNLKMVLDALTLCRVQAWPEKFPVAARCGVSFLPSLMISSEKSGPR